MKKKKKQEKSNKQIGAKVYDQDDAGIFLHDGSVEEFFFSPSVSSCLCG
jgi:hypothetical protein